MNLLFDTDPIPMHVPLEEGAALLRSFISSEVPALLEEVVRAHRCNHSVDAILGSTNSEVRISFRPTTPPQVEAFPLGRRCS